MNTIQIRRYAGPGTIFKQDRIYILTCTITSGGKVQISTCFMASDGKINVSTDGPYACYSQSRFEKVFVEDEKTEKIAVEYRKKKTESFILAYC